MTIKGDKKPILFHFVQHGMKLSFHNKFEFELLTQSSHIYDLILIAVKWFDLSLYFFKFWVILPAK